MICGALIDRFFPMKANMLFLGRGRVGVDDVAECSRRNSDYSPLEVFRRALTFA